MQAALARAVLLAPGAAWRSAAASTIREAAKTAGRSQPLASLLSFSAGTGSAAQLRPAITTTAAAGKAAAAAAAAAVTTAPAVLLRGGAWRAVSSAASAAAHQQSRGFARYLQFQTRGGGGGSGWGRWSEDSDKVLWGLIAANVGGFALWRLAPNLMQTHATVSIEGLRAGRVWTALTAAFSHKDVYHLGANMVGLYFFGRDVGRLFGGKRLLMLYMAGGVAGSLAHCGWYYYQACKTGEGRYGRARWFGFTPSALGASAAVNALTVCDILLYPTRTVLLYAIIPMPAALLGVLWLLNDVSGAMDGHRGHIAHAGHLGGAATGLAFFLAYKRGIIRPRGW